MSREKKRELNQHLHRKHNQAHMNSEGRDLRNRLSLHEELHQTTICDHEHEDYNTPSVFLGKDV